MILRPEILRGTGTLTVRAATAPREDAVLDRLPARADTARYPVTHSGEVGAGYDSVCAGLFKCHAADDKRLS